ncbi:AbrB/MazE/SpoVT family DNA-binding domain-containing protein [Sphingopyxis sp. KK2]|uniref:AbrB/MazE/SpoVT family DNA-binding domain-containing protein n=1 Tax=Sphingopyxis sp. KK2 TaxID=1855727 RepID=UPI00097E5C61|nr:AbrB/MazE/SpoVT family DNA-binding domain-containing protein [Sphingopyxis sp. KK2]
MTKEYRAKVFKSGNSLALRLPKALGLEEGTEMIVREEHGEFRFEPAEKPKAKLDISGFWGKAPGLKVPERRDFDERPSAIAAREAAAKTTSGS